MSSYFVYWTNCNAIFHTKVVSLFQYKRNQKLSQHFHREEVFSLCHDCAIGLQLLYMNHVIIYKSCRLSDVSRKRFLRVQTSFFLSDAPVSHIPPSPKPAFPEQGCSRSGVDLHWRSTLRLRLNWCSKSCTTVGFLVAPDSRCAVTVALQKSRRLRSRVVLSAAVPL